MLLAPVVHRCRDCWRQLTFCHDRWLGPQAGARAGVSEGVRDGLHIYVGFLSRDGMRMRQSVREGGEMEISSRIVWLLAVSSVDLLCSEPQALASASFASSSFTAPCVSHSMKPI